MVEKDDVHGSIVDGHPVDTNKRFHVQPGRFVREYANVVQRVSLVSRARYERLVGAGDTVYPVGPASVLDGRYVCWIPLIGDVLSGLGAEICPVNRKRDRRD